MPQVPRSIYYMRIMSPCKDCNERGAGCHSKCEKYNNWQKIQLEEKRKAWESYAAVRKIEDCNVRSRIKTIMGKK